jgi:hypothetical protein
MDAFNTLSASRDANGFGVNPLRISEIRAYADMLGMRDTEALRLLRITQAMDATYLAHVAKRQERASKGKENG